MRYLIFGDVHGNLPALEKLLKIENGNYDFLISHGDVINYGPWSNECVSLLDSLPNIVMVMGNHEENYIKGRYSGSSEVAQAFFNHCYPKFNRFNNIRRYKEKHDLKDFTIRHTIRNRYIFPDSDLEELELKKNYVIGHSHYQFERRDGNKRLINTGSIGQNRKYINVAEYVILDEDKGFVELKSFLYAIDDVIDKMHQDDYPQICLDYYKSKDRK